LSARRATIVLVVRRTERAFRASTPVVATTS
jgi:hypothetical protein